MAVVLPTVWDVDITLRCTPRHARVARALASSCAALEEFSVDELDDVRLLVDEIFILLCQAGGSTAQLRFAMGNGCLTFDIRADRSVSADDVGVVDMLAGVIAPGAANALTSRPSSFSAHVRRSRRD